MQLSKAAMLTLMRCAASLTVAPAAPRFVGTHASFCRPRHMHVSACAAGGKDEVVTAISGDGSISAKAIVATELISETARLQGLQDLAAAALGRAMMCSLLVAEGLKEDETFQVNFRGDGPLRGVLAIADGNLRARGYVGNPSVTLPPNAKGKLDVSAGVGKGSLQVVRTKHLPGEEVSTPYTSITEIRSGEVAEDINYFLVESEQKEGALAAGVFCQGSDPGVDLNGNCLGATSVQAAGGWFVQLLPFADDAMVEQLQKNLQALSGRSPTQLVRDGVSAEGMLNLLLEGMEPQVLTRTAPLSLATNCECSDERVMRTLRLLPRSELDDIMEKNENIEIKCEFCGIRRSKTPAEIQAQIDDDAD